MIQICPIGNRISKMKLNLDVGGLAPWEDGRSGQAFRQTKGVQGHGLEPSLSRNSAAAALDSCVHLTRPRPCLTKGPGFQTQEIWISSNAQAAQRHARQERLRSRCGRPGQKPSRSLDTPMRPKLIVALNRFSIGRRWAMRTIPAHRRSQGDAGNVWRHLCRNFFSRKRGSHHSPVRL